MDPDFLGLQGKPALGSWISYALGTENQNLPAFVVIYDPRGGPYNGPSNWGAGFLPASYQATTFRATGDPILDQTVMFSVRQSLFPFPPKGSTAVDRTFMITYIYA
jgi:hypothetical protein